MLPASLLAAKAGVWYIWPVTHIQHCRNLRVALSCPKITRAKNAKADGKLKETSCKFISKTC